jgi:hypothetical protein
MYGVTDTCIFNVIERHFDTETVTNEQGFSPKNKNVRIVQHSVSG